MDWKKARILYYILAVIGFILMVLGATGSARVWLYVGIGFMVLCAVVSMLWYRCPHCKAYLGNVGRKLSQCPACGKSLEKAEEE